MKNPMQEHEALILDMLLPIIADHFGQTGCDMTEAALAVFLSLDTILQSQGFPSDSLQMAVNACALVTHESPGGLQ